VPLSVGANGTTGFSVWASPFMFTPQRSESGGDLTDKTTKKQSDRRPPPPPELYGCQAKSWELRA
jgi:hypothetical protein